MRWSCGSLVVTTPQDTPANDLLRCSRCRQVQPASNFNWHRKALGQHDAYCRPCRAEYKQEHYAANRQRYRENSERFKQAWRQERVSYLLAFFKTHHCVDCGEADPRVLEFDHRGEKSFNISYGLQHHAWPLVLAEIEKCDVRCANCHRRKTARSGGFARAVLIRSPVDRTAGH
jgi:hypothetical protein